MYLFAAFVNPAVVIDLPLRRGSARPVGSYLYFVELS
jgi:hypothetical protein